MCHKPSCLFTFLLMAGINIIDRDRLWWPSISTSGTLPTHGWSHPRQIGFCSYTLLSEAAEVLVVEDAQKDHRCVCCLALVFLNINIHFHAPQAVCYHTQCIAACLRRDCLTSHKTSHATCLIPGLAACLWPCRPLDFLGTVLCHALPACVPYSRHVAFALAAALCCRCSMT